MSSVVSLTIKSKEFQRYRSLGINSEERKDMTEGLQIKEGHVSPTFIKRVGKEKNNTEGT